MRYVGSKSRLSKELTPIIQSYITDETKGYIEPFVGGANMIDKINHKNKIGSDIHPQLIALLNYAKNPNNKLPNTITEEEYNRVRNNKDSYDDWYVGLVGFCATYGAKYFGGYARGVKGDKTTPRDYPNEGIRSLEKQRTALEGVRFYNKSFLDYNIEKVKGYVIYCDIPYRGTIKYTHEFPYEDFYAWAKEMAKNNTVLISEYSMPDGFECIWEKTVIVNINSNKKAGEDRSRIEKLFIVKEN